MINPFFTDKLKNLIPFIKIINYYCHDCKKERITKSEYKYSNYKFGRALCRKHQEVISKKISPEAYKLYRELKKKGIGGCTLELYDGFKSVDISIEWACLDIEVDGKHHLLDSKQLFADINRAHYSKENNDFETIHIPNNLINDNVEELAMSIIEVAKKRYGRIKQINSIKNTIKEIGLVLIIFYIGYLFWDGIFSFFNNK